MVWVIIAISLTLLFFIVLVLFLYSFGKIASGNYYEPYTPEQIEEIKRKFSKGDK